MFAWLLAVDDGIWHGQQTLADVLFLIAAILCGIAAFIAYSVKTFYATLMAAAFCLGFIALAVWS